VSVRWIVLQIDVSGGLVQCKWQLTSSTWAPYHTVFFKESNYLSGTIYHLLGGFYLFTCTFSRRQGGVKGVSMRGGTTSDYFMNDN
jgi:hypothetical protein